MGLNPLMTVTIGNRCRGGGVQLRRDLHFMIRNLLIQYWVSSSREMVRFCSRVLLVQALLVQALPVQILLVQVLAAQVLAVAVIFPTASSAAEPVYDIDMYALMSGKCTRLKIAGRDFACKAVAYFHSQRGRADFTVVLDDPADESHIVSFSGENARREQDNLYELSIDRMLLKSKDRPKQDGLPVPAVELSAGTCRQLGSFATRQVSSISCAATDGNGRKYELQFESDGTPITVRRLRQGPLPTEAQRSNQIAQFECRLKAEAAKVMRRDQTAYIIRCLGLAENGPNHATDEQQ